MPKSPKSKSKKNKNSKNYHQVDHQNIHQENVVIVYYANVNVMRLVMNHHHHHMDHQIDVYFVHVVRYLMTMLNLVKDILSTR